MAENSKRQWMTVAMVWVCILNICISLFLIFRVSQMNASLKAVSDELYIVKPRDVLKEVKAIQDQLDRMLPKR